MDKVTVNVVNASFVLLTCWNFIAPGCPALQNLLDMVVAFGIVFM
jgi:hypothetical protein